MERCEHRHVFVELGLIACTYGVSSISVVNCRGCSETRCPLGKVSKDTTKRSCTEDAAAAAEAERRCASRFEIGDIVYAPDFTVQDVHAGTELPQMEPAIIVARSDDGVHYMVERKNGVHVRVESSFIKSWASYNKDTP